MTPYSGIRKMTVADAATVHAIDSMVTVEPWSERLYVDCIGIGYECWVIVDDKQVIGFGIMNYAANEAHILNLAITTARQRQGWGEKMLQHLLNLARQHGSDEIFLEVRYSNEPAIALYKKYNFVEVGIRKNYYPLEADGEGREDALTLALSLW
jgi:ribosomal-protein-alanine N-acetyltransferase